ncbi:hypothetical protein HZA96_02235 [Candidatus Woesearchaeota archaeon]|nr:hypothetical protein [Candidatus Woesearchaeota archaeon]
MAKQSSPEAIAAPYIGKLESIGIDQILTLPADISGLIVKLDNFKDYLNACLRLVDITPQEPAIDSVANEKLISLDLQLSKESLISYVSIQYSTTKNGLFSAKTSTLLVFCDNEIKLSHLYKLPTKKKPICSKDIGIVVDQLERLILEQQYTVENEKQLVIAVANATGIPMIANAYFSKKYYQLVFKH